MCTFVLFALIYICLFLNNFCRDVKNSTVTSPIAPVSVSVMSYDGTLLSDVKQITPLRATNNNGNGTPGLPNRLKGPTRASSTSSLDRISEGKKCETISSLKECFIQGVGWASQVRQDFNLLLL